MTKKRKPPKIQTWEYMTVDDLNPVDDDFDEELDGYGALGWELVSISPTGWLSPSHICVFKKPT